MHFPFCPENKSISKDDINIYMKEIKPENYISHDKLICDWTDKKKCQIHYRIFNFYVRHGMVSDKTHEIVSFEQSKWLEKYINFNNKTEIKL